MQETNTICRCCLNKGIHKNLHSPYTWLDKKEIYSDMLQECFNIVLNNINEFDSICETCIGSLRDSLQFKLKVLNSDKELSQLIENKKSEEKKEIKVEPKVESDNESDDYFLIDAIKEESPPPSSKIKREQKKTKSNKVDDWLPEKYKTLVKRITANSDEIPLKNDEKYKIVKKKKITIKNNVKNDVKINISWMPNSLDVKKKHRENLLTLLKYSNILPFKNKSLLGYICGYCDATYPDPIDLRKHTEADHKKERLEFRSSFDMTEYNVKLDITDLTCTLCDEKMENLAILSNHLVKVHEKTFYTDIKDHLLQFKLKKGDVYDCTMCSSTYETFKMLKQHMNIHYCNYKCSKCESSFTTKRSLNSHQAIHQEGSFKCDHCDKVFSSKTKKQYHEKSKHMGARNIRNCPYCNVPFRSYYQRNQHLVKVHNSEAQYKCNVCNKGYILKSLLMCHIKKSHLMELNCQCTECGYRFFSKKALKAHMIKHTGERKYRCEVCHKAYARKYTLREHMRIHNNDRRFKCEVCSTAFVQKCSLKSHLLSHHGISMAASDITSS